MCDPDTPGTTFRENVQAVRDALDPNSFDPQDRRRVRDARRSLNTIDKDRFWSADGNQLIDDSGSKALRFMRIAVNHLWRIDDASAPGHIDEILDQMQQLAEDRIDLATSDGGSAAKLTNAQTRFDAGETNRAAGKVAAAANHYRAAWKIARKA